MEKKLECLQTVECYACGLWLRKCVAEQKEFMMDERLIADEDVTVIGDSGGSSVWVTAWFCPACARKMEGSNEIED